MSETRLAAFSYSRLDVELKAPFGIATGEQQVANNVLVRVELDDETVGWGEAAPFPAVSGETQRDVLAALSTVEGALAPLNLENHRLAAEVCRDLLGGVPTAQAAVEMALLDALCKKRRCSMTSFFGGAETSLTSDITLVTGTTEQAIIAAREATLLGFDQLKVKIGATNVDDDTKRLKAIADAAPAATLLLDANCGYETREALELLRALGSVKERIAIFEQPTPRDDFAALAEIEAKGGVPVAADESLRGPRDLAGLIRQGGISAVNIKTAKFGLFQAYDLLITAKVCGLTLMIGGMVETELSMSVSACLGAGVGGLAFVDLDTPLFMKERPLRGGYQQDGPFLDLACIELGHGVEPLSDPMG